MYRRHSNNLTRQKTVYAHTIIIDENVTEYTTRLVFAGRLKHLCLIIFEVSNPEVVFGFLHKLDVINVF